MQIFFDRRSSRQLQFDSLDGLRGAAVLLVLLSHLSGAGYHLAPGLDFNGAGKYGVFLFFSLSAFLLSLPLLRLEPRDLASGRRWLAYAARRLLRIAPLYSLVLATHYALSTLYPTRLFSPMDLAALGRHLTLQEGVNIYWAIPVEFSYYLALPFYAAVAVAMRRHFLVLAAATFAGILLCIGWLLPPASYPTNTIALGAYLPVFLLGSLAAVAQHRITEAEVSATRARARWMEWAAFGSATGVIVAIPSVWSLVTGQPIEPHGFHRSAALFGLLWAIFLVAHLNGVGWIRGLLAQPALRYVGIVSFSIYLWHVPVLRALRLGWPALPEWLFAWVGIAASLLVGGLSFAAIERPFLRSQPVRRLLKAIERAR